MEWLLEEPIDLRRVGQQLFHLAAQLTVIRAGRSQELLARIGRPGQRGLAQALDQQSTGVWFCGH